MIVLELFSNKCPASSLSSFTRQFEGTVYLTCTSGSIFDQLNANHQLVASEYIDGIASGQCVNGTLCQDIQNTSFPNDTFDLIITEDVLEHVPLPEKAFAEIGRILKSGGYHVSTIPVNWSRDKSVARATIIDGKVHHHMEPEYHGDPTRPEGILAYTEYGRDIVEKYCSITGPSIIQAAHKDVKLRTIMAYIITGYLCQERNKALI